MWKCSSQCAGENSTGTQWRQPVACGCGVAEEGQPDESGRATAKGEVRVLSFLLGFVSCMRGI